MTTETKKYVLLTTMVVSFILMFNTKYLRAPGDYLLEFIGLKSWTDDLSGTHLTVIYFGVIFFISLFLIEHYLVNQSVIKWRRVIVILFMSIALYVSLTSTTIQIMMRRSDTLSSIEYQSEVGHLDYKKDNGLFTEFNALFRLKNFSKDERVFHVSFNSSWRREEGQSDIRVLNMDGSPAIFKLAGDEVSIFEVNQSSYQLVDEDNEGSYNSQGILDELILTDLSGNRLVLEYDKSYSLRINR